MMLNYKYSKNENSTFLAFLKWTKRIDSVYAESKIEYDENISKNHLKVCLGYCCNYYTSYFFVNKTPIIKFWTNRNIQDVTSPGCTRSSSNKTEKVALSGRIYKFTFDNGKWPSYKIKIIHT